MKNRAILSMIYENTPGVIATEIGNWNLLNLPNPGVPHVNSFFDAPFSVNKLMTHEKL